MIRLSAIFFLILCLFVVTDTGVGQTSGSYPVYLGIGIGGMNGNKEFDGNTEFQARLFLRHYFSENVEGELGVGAGSITDWFYDTKLYPFDYRFLYAPTYYDQWNPYLYVGIGFVGYEVSRPDIEQLPAYMRPTYKTSGMSAYVPLGIGAEIDLDEGLGLDLNLGYNIAFTDNLNGIRTDDPSDAFWTFGVGLTFSSDGTSRHYARTTIASSDSRRWDRRVTGPDADGDGLSDEEEWRYHTDPYNPDSDGDGIRDSYEIFTFHTDPSRYDTDGDGLSDGDEVRMYNTDPLKRDTDGDGLDDNMEVKATKTNPIDPDTDHGGVKDGAEVAQHLNPMDASDDKLYTSIQPVTPSSVEPKPSTDRRLDLSLRYLLNGIVFQTGSAQISPASIGILNNAVRVLVDNPDLVVEIQGHTDNVGGAAFNLDLSRRRATAVKSWLVNKGINERRLTIKGFGYSRPIASNSTEDGRQQNRRIEFVIVR